MRIRVGVGCVAAVVSAWSLAWATTTAGRLDPAFGVDGVQTVAQPMTDVRDAAIDAQDRLVSVGYASRAVGGVTVARWVVQRFTTTGGLDATFAAGGVYEMEGVTSADRADAVAVAPDGRILVGGYRSWASGGKRPSTQIAGALLCLSANGTVDWRVDLPGYPFVNDLVIVPVGSGYEIVVAKRDDVTTTVSSGGKGKGTSTTSEAIALLRFNASGTLLSTTYDEVSTTHSDVPIVVRQDGLGRLVVGFRQTGTGATRWGIARYLATGSLDTTFGTNGRVMVAPVDGAEIHDIAIDGDGRRVVACGTDLSPYGGVLVRYAENGTSHEAFPVPVLAEGMESQEVEVDAQGNVLLQAWIGDADWDVTVVRFTPSGQLDLAYGPAADGFAEPFDLSTQDRPGPMRLDGEGRLLMATQTWNATAGRYEAVVCRWLP